MTAYFFDKAKPDSGASACTGQCAANWPDKAAGDTNGQGVLGMWYVISPDGKNIDAD